MEDKCLLSLIKVSPSFSYSAIFNSVLCFFCHRIPFPALLSSLGGSWRMHRNGENGSRTLPSLCFCHHRFVISFFFIFLTAFQHISSPTCQHAPRGQKNSVRDGYQKHTHTLAFVYISFHKVDVTDRNCSSASTGVQPPCSLKRNHLHCGGKPLCEGASPRSLPI